VTVIHGDEQRRVSGDVGEQIQHRHGDAERLGRFAFPDAERCGERCVMR